MGGQVVFMEGRCNLEAGRSGLNGWKKKEEEDDN